MILWQRHWEFSNKKRNDKGKGSQSCSKLRDVVLWTTPNDKLVKEQKIRQKKIILDLESILPNSFSS